MNTLLTLSDSLLCRISNKSVQIHVPGVGSSPKPTLELDRIAAGRPRYVGMVGAYPLRAFTLEERQRFGPYKKQGHARFEARVPCGTKGVAIPLQFPRHLTTSPHRALP